MPEMVIHSYTLAKDDPTYSGPPWVPFNLWMQAEFGMEGKLHEHCARKLIESPGARAVWDAIAQRYGRPDNIAAELPRQCADALLIWRNTPKDTPASYKERMLSLQRDAERIAGELDRFFLHRSGYGEPDFGKINFTQLLSEEEQTDMEQRILSHNRVIYNAALAAHGLKPSNPDEHLSIAGVADTYELLIMDDRWAPGIVPLLPDLLRRIGKLLAEDAEAPPLQRPNTENAERNFFVRSLLHYFRQSTSEGPSPALIAAIAGIFFPQGITDNEVSQQIGRLRSGRPLKRA